jgi:hypothetical protein
VWKHEAYDFTSWLEDNMDVLGEILDLELSTVEREKSVGSFNIDLVAEDADGNTVIIENQLGMSDHDHLGKVLTYLTSMEAKIGIWITKDARPEHIKAIAWLNESSSASFYLVKVEAIKIGESAPAPLLTLIVGPSEEGKEIGKKKKEMSERYALRYEFWKKLLEYAQTMTKLHATRSPTQHNWVGGSSGVGGLSYNYSVTQHEITVELYIDKGKENEEENIRIFEDLRRSSEEIERVFGEPLEWQRLEDRRACRIRKVLDVGGYRDPEESWAKIHEAAVDSMIRLDRAFRPYIQKQKV